MTKPSETYEPHKGTAEPLEVIGKIRKEGSPSWMWAMWVKEPYNGELLISEPGFMMHHNATQDLLQIIEDLNTIKFTAYSIADDPVDNFGDWQPFSIVTSSAKSWGQLAWVITRPPIVCRAMTYYGTSEDIEGRIDLLMKNTFKVVDIEVEEFEEWDHEDDMLE